MAQIYFGETLNLCVTREDGTIIWQTQMPPGVREIVLAKPADNCGPSAVYTRYQIYDDMIVRRNSQTGVTRKLDEERNDEDELLNIYRTEAAQ